MKKWRQEEEFENIQHRPPPTKKVSMDEEWAIYPWKVINPAYWEKPAPKKKVIKKLGKKMMKKKPSGSIDFDF
jgi:hypothetical protein